MRITITRRNEMVKDGLNALFVGLRRIIFSGDFAGAQRSLYFLGWTPSDKRRLFDEDDANLKKLFEERG